MRQINELLTLLDKALETTDFQFWTHECDNEVRIGNMKYNFKVGRDFTKLTVRENDDWKTDIDILLNGELDKQAVAIVAKANKIKNESQPVRGGDLTQAIDFLKSVNTGVMASLSSLKKEAV